MTQENINEMTQEQIQEMMKYIEALEQENSELKEQLENRKKGHGRKAQVLALLEENGKMRIEDIAKALGISTKNVSSQLTYLREDYDICTDRYGRKFIA